MTAPLWRRFTPSVFGQVFGLLVLILVAAQAVNIGILYFLPPPQPEVFRAGEVVQALRAPGRTISTGGGRALRATVTATPAPASGQPRARRFTERLKSLLAGQLGVAPDRVRLTLLDNERFPFRRDSRGFGPGGPPPPAAERNGQPPRPEGPAQPAGFGGGGFNGFGGPNGRDDFRGRMGFGGGPGGPGARLTPWGEPLVVSPFVASVRLADGRWSNLAVRDEGLFGTWQRRVLLWLGVCLLALAPVAYLFARGLASPIAAFARAAERLGRDPGAPPLTLQGPAEVATAVAAFNEMQDRLRRYVQDRTATVGAIAHDLRTPLTRLRFRLESLPEGLRHKISADIDEMEQMIAATLAFVRDDSLPAERRRLELGSLVGTVADEMADMGKDVSAAGAGGPVVIEGDALALRRLTANLVDNAVKFGVRARVRVLAEDGSAVIEVDDDGPGIGDADMGKVFEPFRRGEPSRSRETGGAGLGLAVVRSIARAHGGDAALENRPSGGLRARVWLPLAPVNP